MSESHSPQLEGPLGEELVAYLDGELDEAGRRRVEQRLAADDATRRALGELQRAWDMLDQLPQAEVSDSFTRSTVELAVVSAGEEVAQAGAVQRRQRWSWLAVTAAAVLLGLLVGYSAVYRLTTRPHRELARDLPLLEQLSVYRHIDSLAFLRALDEADLFNDAFAETEGTITAAAPKLGETLEQRQVRLESLEPRARLNLQQSTREFQALSPEQQQRLRELYQELSEQPDAPQLAAVAAQYHEWLLSLPGSQRVELVDLPAEERLSEIAKLLKQQEAERMREWMQTPLSSDDVDTLFTWLDEYAREHLTEELEKSLIEKMPWEFRGRIRAAEPAERRRLLLGASYRFRIGSHLPTPTKADFAELAGRLSDRPRLMLTQAPEEAAQLMLLQSWVRMAFFSRHLPNITAEDLDDFLKNKVDAGQRASLESLPAEEMQQELRKLYIGNWFKELQRGGGGGGRWSGGPWSGGPWTGGPRPEFRGEGPRGDGRGDNNPRGEGPRGEGRRGGEPGRGGPRPNGNSSGGNSSGGNSSGGNSSGGSAEDHPAEEQRATPSAEFEETRSETPPGE